MGQEFCKGCEDCTNFKNNEGDLSYFANKPIQSLKNPYLINGNLDNSILNKTDIQNDISILTNNNQNKNEISRISSLNSKNVGNNLSRNLLTNTKFYQRESEDIFKQKNEDEEYNNNENGYKKNNTKDNGIFYNEEIDEIQQKKRNNGVKKIKKIFKEYMKRKAESHKEIFTDNSTLNDNNYISNNIRNELDVNLAPDSNYLYIGTKYNYKKDGYGLELFSDSKAKYFGKFINDKRVHIGKFKIDNDNYSYYYYGEVKGLYANGFGISENCKESIYYEGMWVNSKKEGYGIEKYNKDNSIYKGCFSNGKKNGIGHYIWNDNSSYKGEWLDGTLNGYGIYHFQDGSIYKGSWENNRMSGLGEFTFPEIKTYLGYFKRDKRAGFGILIWYKEKKVFLGFWKENKQNGLGKFISNGKIRYGIWEKGVLKDKINDEQDFIDKMEGDEKYYLNLLKSNKYEEIREKIENILSF